MGEYRGACMVYPFLRYANARLKKDIEAKAYRTYMTDGLRALAGGSSWERWYDVIRPKTTNDKRTGIQIKADIQTRLKSMWGGEEE